MYEIGHYWANWAFVAVVIFLLILSMHDTCQEESFCTPCGGETYRFSSSQSDLC